MGQVLTVALAKGGAGKTSVSANLAVALAQRGLSVLLIDLDPQANLTSAFGVKPKKLAEMGSSADLLYSPMKRQLAECILPDVAPGVDLVPAVEGALYLADDDLRRGIGAESKLARALRGTEDIWSWTIIDLPPALKGPAVVNAFVASTFVLSPVTPSSWAAQGASRVKAAVEEVRLEELGTAQYLGVVWNKVLPGRSSQEFVIDQVRDLGTLPIFNTVIPHRQAAEDAELLGLPAASDPDSDLGMAFADLAGELLAKTGVSSDGVGTPWRERQAAKRAAKAEKSKKGKKKKKKGAA